MYEHRTVIGDGLISAEQLNSMSEEGWELIQIIPHFENMTEINPGQYAFYFRRMCGTIQ